MEVHYEGLQYKYPIRLLWTSQVAIITVVSEALVVYIFFKCYLYEELCFTLVYPTSKLTRPVSLSYYCYINRAVVVIFHVFVMPSSNP